MIIFYHLLSNIGKKSCLEFPALILKRRVIPGTSNAQINEKKIKYCMYYDEIKFPSYVNKFLTSEIYLIETNSLNHYLY